MEFGLSNGKHDRYLIIMSFELILPLDRGTDTVNLYEFLELYIYKVESVQIEIHVLPKGLRFPWELIRPKLNLLTQ